MSNETDRARKEREEAEERGRGLKPDTSPEAGLAGNLSDEDPGGRDKRVPAPKTYEVTEDGDD